MIDLNQVKVSPFLFEDTEVFIGRTALKAAHFPENKLANGERYITGAACGLDKENVQLRAMGEVIERVCGFQSGIKANSLMKMSYSELCDRNIDAISPKTRQQFLPHQELPKAYWNSENAVISWSKGINLTQNKTTYVPALSSYLSWKPAIDEQVFVRPDATGVAAGTDEESTQMRAILEVIERSACIRSWRDPKTTVIRLIDPLIPTMYFNLLERMGWVLDVYLLTSTNLPDTAMALLSKSNDAELTIGSACGLSTNKAIKKAIEEAFMLQDTVQNFRNKITSIPQPTSSLQHILNAYTNGTFIKKWYNDRAIEKAYSPSSWEISLEEMVEHVQIAYNSDVIAIDLTDDFAREINWYVFRVIIPGATLKESNSTLMHLSHFSDSMNKEINLEPHPFG